MEMEERDFVTFTDDNGEEFELDVVDYFEYEGEEYAVLMDLSEECEDEEDEYEHEHEHEHEHAHDVYIMKIVVEGDEENFVPADEDKFEVLSAIVEERLSNGCCCGDEDCDCEDDECDDDHCGCHCGCEHDK
jgi:uncharacterized protein YrzB (UPF0473 family)